MRFSRAAGRRPLLWGHRGAPHDAPENTLAAFAAALDRGADGVELDVRRCASGELVVAHDPTFERLLGDPSAVSALRWPRISQMRLDGERIPQLGEALDLADERDALVNVEIKGDVPDRIGLARRVAHELARRPPDSVGRVLVSSFSPRVCWVFRRAAPAVALSLLYDAQHVGPVRLWAALELIRPHGVHPEHVLVRGGSLRRHHRRGRFVNAWTPNEPSRIRELAASGVDGIITDDIEVARDALGD